VQAIAIMTLVGGILAILGSLCWFAYVGLMSIVSMGFGLVCCLWPGPYYGLVVGIMAAIRGANLIGKDGHRAGAPRGIAIMQIINIINFDVPNFVMGVLTLAFLNDREVQSYFRD
jgi:hypothetical protein